MPENPSIDDITPGQIYAHNVLGIQGTVEHIAFRIRITLICEALNGHLNVDYPDFVAHYTLVA